MENYRPYILYVDDDVVDQMIFKKAISQINPNYDIVTMNNPEEGLQYIDESRTPPALIVSDINMPKMGGKEFINIIAAHPIKEKIPFVIFSTFSEQEKNDFLSLGAKGCFRKSSSFSTLQSEIAKIINICEEEYC